MAKQLIIVESPTKVKTIKKFLGSNYQVIASNGHIRDLPKSSIGIDIDNDFEPKYITIRGKGEKLSEIKKEAKKASKIYLATDPDREGEAISWHLKNAINMDSLNFKRITFNEITKEAVKEALKNPREIDMNLVNAQQARRTLDRIVGYKISPLLWKKIKKGLSAGRVQSVSLKLIADRDSEIASFISTEYYTVDAIFTYENKSFSAKLYSYNNKKINLDPYNIETIKKDLLNDKYEIDDIKCTKRTKLPPLPFTTSTLQQEASKKLGYQVSKTMRIAQELYEGIKIDSKGSVGLITYLRTDSTRLSDVAIASAKSFILDQYGKEYIGDKSRKNQTKIMQDAHEAIRPSHIELEPSKISGSLTRDQLKLYTLIWNRFIASQMAAQVNENISVTIKSDKGYKCKASSHKILFKGYLEVYTYEQFEKENNIIHTIPKDAKIDIKDVDVQKHHTEPPAHYNEASLIRTLESLGIGRPSTYAPTITTLKARNYITMEKKNLYITELGNIVNNLVSDYFKEIVDVKFTARMEKYLDDVADGNLEWKQVLRDYYPLLDEEITEAEKKLEKIIINDEVTDEICEKCGRNMVIKYGRHGKFLACPGFPECKNSKTYYEKIGVKCPKCGSDVVIKLTSKHRKYYGCISYPNCEFASWNEPTGQICPECSEYLIKKGNKIVCSNRECKYEQK